MNLLTLISQYKFQSLVNLLMGLILSGIGISYQLQRQNQRVLSALLNKISANTLETNENKKILALLTNIQATQAEQNGLLAQWVSISKVLSPIKIPASNMNKFKSGSYKLLKRQNLGVVI